MSVLIAALIGIPIGIAARRGHGCGAWSQAVIDTLQTLPSFVYLIPVVMLFRVGDFTAMIAIVLYALTPAVRYTAHGIMQVARTLSGGRGDLGLHRRQLLWRVRLPLALPQILLGINQTIMLAISMLVITALVGTRDLGQEVYVALAKADIGRGLVAGLCVAFIAITADRLHRRRDRPSAPAAWPGLSMDARTKAASLAIWRRPVEPEPLGGGITNANFLVDDGQRRYFVRIGDDIPVHHILRWHELAASRAAHAAGISPAVLHAEPGVLVLDLVEGRTFGPEDIRERRNLERIVPLLRRVPSRVAALLRGPTLAFWVFHVLRDYAAGLAEARHRLAADLPGSARPRRAPGAGGGTDRAASSATTTCSPPT